MPTPDVDPMQLLQVAELADDDYDRFVLTWLVRPTPQADAVLTHATLQRRTWVSLARAMKAADQHDRKGAPQQERDLWRRIRDAARERRTTMPRPEERSASPRRRALQRLAELHPEEWQALQRAGRKAKRRVSMRELAKRHEVEFSALVWEERRRQDPTETPGEDPS